MRKKGITFTAKRDYEGLDEVLRNPMHVTTALAGLKVPQNRPM